MGTRHVCEAFKLCFFFWQILISQKGTGGIEDRKTPG